MHTIENRSILTTLKDDDRKEKNMIVKPVKLIHLSFRSESKLKMHSYLIWFCWKIIVGIGEFKLLAKHYSHSS